MTSQTFGAQGPSAAGSGNPKDFAHALFRFEHSSWHTPVREAKELIKVNSKFPRSRPTKFLPGGQSPRRQWLTDHPPR